MNFFKRIPIKYIGELHDVRLINFSVDIKEIKERVPARLKVRDFNGRAIFSMVDVKLKNMCPAFFPNGIHFDYRHIAFRLLMDDSNYNQGVNKGIFFYRSFTDQSLIVRGGSIFTDYNLEEAHISETDELVEVKQGSQVIRYKPGSTQVPMDRSMEELKHTVGALDRAYSMLGNEIRVTQIQREKWPIQPVNCPVFENTFFQTARFEGAFRVFETIYYTWLPPKSVSK